MTTDSASNHYADRLAAAIARYGAPVCVGIDPVLERLPAEVRARDATVGEAAAALERFGRGVIDVVADVVPVVKLNIAFFEVARGAGVAAYDRLVGYAHERGLLVIGDIKRGDIGSTARMYARGHLADPIFGDLPREQVPDAVTLAGYLGRHAVEPFAEIAAATGRGVYVLVRPSDPGADEVHEFGGQRRFYEHMAILVREWGDRPARVGRSGLSCVGAVVAPKDIESTRALRVAMSRTPWLVPGFGAQGATAEACAACFGPGGSAAVVNASRSVIYAFERPADGEDWQASVQRAAIGFAREIARVAASA